MYGPLKFVFAQNSCILESWSFFALSMLCYDAELLGLDNLFRMATNFHQSHQTDTFIRTTHRACCHIVKCLSEIISWKCRFLTILASLLQIAFRRNMIFSGTWTCVARYLSKHAYRCRKRHLFNTLGFCATASSILPRMSVSRLQLKPF